MQVDIWSDVMCPFCYIGKRHFENALEQFAGKEDVHITWRSFQLDPTLPENNPGEDLYTYLQKHKGISRQQLTQMHTHVTNMAAKAGLEYHLENTQMVSSFKAHRLLQKAKEKGLGDAAEERLFYANFTQNKDFSNSDVLLQIGAEIGLQPQDVEDALNNPIYAQQVQQDIADAQGLGIRGVPFFVFDNKYGVSGAQPPQTFVQVLQKSFGEWQAGKPIANGAACTVDGECD